MQVRDHLHDLRVGLAGSWRLGNCASALACWWLGIHFEEHLVLCGGSHCIFWTVHIDHGSLYIWLVAISLGHLAETFGILCKYYFDQV